MVEDGVGGRELARCTRSTQGDGSGGVEDGGRGEGRRLLLATFHVIYLVKSPDLGDWPFISVGSVCTPTAMKLVLTARQT